MSRIRSKDTKPEILVRKYLFANGLRYRLHDKNLPGKPDIVFPGRKIAIFIHGCFWHGHEGCKYFKEPETRKEWWLAKIAQNKMNDEKNRARLIAQGWRVISIFECKLKPGMREVTLENLLKELQNI